MPTATALKYSRSVRQTLHWLVPDSALEDPQEAIGETRYLLTHALRLHESLTRLPRAGTNSRCLVVGSWGMEAPYLIDRLGWQEVTCVHAPCGRSETIQSRTRRHPNGERRYSFQLLEHDIESGPLPFPDEHFGLVVYWGCLEHLRHDPEFSLFELNRVAQYGATLSLVTENAISIQATHGMLHGRPTPMRLNWPASDGPWRLYTPKEIEEILVGTGWRADTLTTIVKEPPIAARWWKRWMYRHVIADCRRGVGMAEPYWNAFILAEAAKVEAPTRAYPSWLYRDEKIRRLKVQMLELVSGEAETLEYAEIG